uniref:Uncharacterized protein n=1 Tax=Alexandrium andersonii TaxID=327968 RepID=A0A7S2IAI3_9DINO|mmetsp:Transcript_80960/g.181132  ORF Transcript_80960/g.181132 Transcript_80960/m.181132 type:complete len:145 (+) Transcript_80960:87-521(+)
MVLPKAMKAKAKTAAKGAMKSMKAKRTSKVARGRLARYMVFKGRKEKTVGGVKAEGLMRNKRGKIVSKRASANGRRAYKNVADWIEALMEARTALHTKGFVAINGRTLQGKALYLKAKALREQRKMGQRASSSSSAPADTGNGQ